MKGGTTFGPSGTFAAAGDVGGSGFWAFAELENIATKTANK
jgi:hypothetical protein